MAIFAASKLLSLLFLAYQGISAVPTVTDLTPPVPLTDLPTLDQWPTLEFEKTYSSEELEALVVAHQQGRDQHDAEASPATLEKRNSPKRVLSVEYNYHCPHLGWAKTTFKWGASYSANLHEIVYERLTNVDKFGEEYFNGDVDPVIFRNSWEHRVCKKVGDFFCAYRYEGHFMGYADWYEDYFSMTFRRSDAEVGFRPTVVEKCESIHAHSATCAATPVETATCTIFNTDVTVVS